MVPESRSQRLTLPITPIPAAPLAGVVVAVLTAALFALIPVAALESMIVRSGIAAVLAAAEPPLGTTARIVLILIGGGLAGLIAWLATFLVVGARRINFAKGRAGSDVPVLRRADAHPDAPARAPLFAARDLGTPFLEIRADQPSDEAAAAPSTMTSMTADDIAPRPLPIMRSPIDLPADLDQPLSAYDAASIPVVPIAPPAPPPPPLAPQLAPRPQVIDAGERFETFDLKPLADPALDRRPPVTPRATVDTKATLTALLERLERGVAERAERPTPPQEGIEETLGLLRRMATRG